MSTPDIRGRLCGKKTGGEGEVPIFLEMSFLSCFRDEPKKRTPRAEAFAVKWAQQAITMAAG